MKTWRVYRLVRLPALLLLVLSCSLSSPGGGVQAPPQDTIVAGTHFIGRGYDMTSNYADPSQIKGEVLNFDAMQAAGLMEQIKLEQTELTTVEGKTLSDYLNELTLKVSVGGSYKGFSGSVKANFSATRSCHTEYSFATVQELTRKYSARMKSGTTVAMLKSYLTDAAKAAINNPALASGDLFTSWGTHVLRGIVLGGRLDYSMSADMSKVKTTQTIGALVKVAYNGDFKINSSVDFASKDEKETFQSQADRALQVYGGMSEYGTSVATGDSADYAPWVKSINDNPVFCDFDKTTPVIPIWEFCDDAGNASRLQAGFTSYVQTSQITQTPLGGVQQCIVKLKLWDSPSDFSGSLPAADAPGDSWVRLPYDFNAGAGGNKIYLLIEFGPVTQTNPAPITDLKIINTSKGEHADTDFSPVEVYGGGDGNLNDNASHYSGLFGSNDPQNLYLYHRRGSSAPLTGIGEEDIYTDDTRHSCVAVPGADSAPAVLRYSTFIPLKFANLGLDFNEGTHVDTFGVHLTDHIYLRSAEKVTTCFAAASCDRKYAGGLHGKGAKGSKNLAD